MCCLNISVSFDVSNTEHNNANWCFTILSRTKPYIWCLYLWFPVSNCGYKKNVVVVLELIPSLRFVELLLIFQPLPPAVLQLPSQGLPSHHFPGHDVLISNDGLKTSQIRRKSCSALNASKKHWKDHFDKTSTFWPTQELDTFHISDTVHTWHFRLFFWHF